MNYRFSKLISLFKKLGNVLKPLMAQGVFVFVPNVLIIGNRFLPAPNSDEHKIVYEAIRLQHFCHQIITFNNVFLAAAKIYCHLK